MKIQQIVTEAKVLFTSEQFQQAAAESEFGVVYVCAYPNGEIRIGYPEQSRSGAVQFTVVPAKKEIETRNNSFGNKIMPRAQQALLSLMQAGIIDNTWTIATQRGPSYRPVDNGKYRTDQSQIDQQGLDELIKQSLRLSPDVKNLVLYHGTSMLDWQRIQQVGLHPLQVGSNNMGGGESRGKHELNTGVLYLAGSMDKAMDYAKLRSSWQNRRVNGGEYNKTDSNAPVILSVQVPDPAKLVADDDALIQIAQAIARRIWKAKSPEEKATIAQKISTETGSTWSVDNSYMLWREGDGFPEIMQRFPRRAVRMWLASLVRNNQVGYRGIIPPQFLRLQLVIQ